jgi:glutamine amidotransferase
MITIIDYGMGNLRSVQKAIESTGAQAVITDDPLKVKSADKVILPGVGAMAPAIEKLKAIKMVPAIKEFISSGKPFLGICLGLQLLFEESDEGGKVKGLGILKGRVARFDGKVKVPHMGWNEIRTVTDNPLFTGTGEIPYVYFCHSYYVKPSDQTVTAATTPYGIDFASAVHSGNIWGVQFHPEKSQDIGLKILKNFVGLKA